ncbi:hypothetical protein QBC47DRAFT_371380 [Echria macrotheca]|uniref:RING-CH-type domain-containing protein n=1 Tax=Echria macrotheca TaxID=438768 RepID=A0AAJ0BJS9_9PEZI|nr:hypothetical protein QBC47DRAFT_371380 [Echria macrotheca]
MATTPDNNPLGNIVPAPIATENTQHICFICLQTDADTPDGDWVHPCPCSLEAHESCMLRWVAEIECQPTGQSKALRCPVCRARIYIDEPYDPLIVFHNKVFRAYRRASPGILLSLLASGTLVSSAWYGWNALSIFAGPRTAYRWLGLSSVREMRRQGPVWNVLLTSVFRLTQLSMIGPAMVVIWFAPALGVTFIPTAMLYGTALVARNDFPTWPPSPQWAIALMPHVRLAYRLLYAELVGPLDIRLNLAMRGRPANEEPGPGQGQGAQGAQGENAQENQGAWQLTWALARTFYNLFIADDQRDENGEPAPPEVDIDIRIGGAVDDDEGDDAAPAENREEPVGEAQEEFQVAEEEVEPAEQPVQAPEQPFQAPEQPAQAPEPAAQPAPAPAQPARQNRRNRRRDRAQAVDPMEEPRESFLGYMMTSLTTSLLLPGISYGLGEAIRYLVPKSWTHRPSYRRPPTGLLQMRWGRSLAGACLFFVLRDVSVLVWKWRRVKVKQGRRIRDGRNRPRQE